jgi:hypothetical protein
MNGLGERAGNTPTEEVVLNLMLNMGIETGEFYIGQHTSKTSFDKKYYGSGLWVKEMKKQKNYKDILRVDILLYCASKEELMIKENKIILEHIDNHLNKNISDWSQYFGAGENHSQHDKTSYYWLNIKTNEMEFTTKYNMKVKYNLNPTGVSNLVSGTIKTSKDWCFVGDVLPDKFDIDEHIKTIKKSKNINQSLHMWYNVISNETISMIQYDFQKKYKVNASFLVKNNEKHKNEFNQELLKEQSSYDALLTKMQNFEQEQKASCEVAQSEYDKIKDQ